MVRGRLWTLAAAGLLSMGAAAARADQGPAPAPGEVSGKPVEPAPTTPAAEAAAAPAARRPLMGVLDHAGVAKPLDDYGINIFGHVEASSTYNMQGNSTNAGRVFDTANEIVDFNQADLTFERTVDVTKKKFDVGGRVEWIYGDDAGFIHSNGLFDWYNGPRSPGQQWDLNQAYLDWAIPVGEGLKVRTGKMVTHMGYETINPTTNPLYSHTYLFGFAIPFTHTGAMAFYKLSDSVTVMGGFSRGWEQSLEDNNDSLDALSQVAWTVNDKTSIILSNTTGPEAAGNNSDYRTVFDLIATYQFKPDLLLALNGDFGYESDAAVGGGDAQWFGLAGYATQKLCERVSATGRLEWFDDHDGARGLGTTVYEATLGVSITPFPSDPLGSNFKLRPEIRYDYAQDSIFDGGTENNQITIAMDAIFTF